MMYQATPIDRPSTAMNIVPVCWYELESIQLDTFRSDGSPRLEDTGMGYFGDISAIVMAIIHRDASRGKQVHKVALGVLARSSGGTRKSQRIQMIWAFPTFSCFQRQMLATFLLGLLTYMGTYVDLSYCIYPTYILKKTFRKRWWAFSQRFLSVFWAFRKRSETFSQRFLSVSWAFPVRYLSECSYLRRAEYTIR